MTKLVFETATFAEAIKKADKIAPSKGAAFDKASGIIIEFDPTTHPSVVLRATNLDIFYREWVDTVSVEGEAKTWRLPSNLIAPLVASLPIGTGRNVTLEEVKKGEYPHLIVSSGKTKARFNLMTTEFYPDWDIFDPDDLQPVNDLGGRISLVEWAASNDTAPIDCLFFNGKDIVTTDRYRLARTPMPIPHVPEPGVMVKAGILGSVLKQTGEVKVGFTEHQMLLMPNDTTQLRIVRTQGEYPSKISVIMDPSRESFVELPKTQLLEIMRRANTFSGGERMPTVRMFFGAEELAVMMDNADVGVIADVVDVPGQCVHKRVEIKFTPRNLMEALEKAPNERVRLGYDTTNPGKIMYIDGGSGYEAWVVTRRDGEAG